MKQKYEWKDEHRQKELKSIRPDGLNRSQGRQREEDDREIET
jgi:hypothetical protein